MMTGSRDQSLTVPEPQPGHIYPAVHEIPPARSELVIPEEAKRALWERVRLDKIFLFSISLYLFILAITLMKGSASAVTPLLTNTFSITTAANSLGFGWLFAYVIMSGSPVAAAALTFFDAGVIDELSAFAMITGSRLGASFIVLFIGLIYVLRGRDRATSLNIGLLSLTITATIYLPGLILGSRLLKSGTLDGIQLSSGALLHSVIDLVIEPVARPMVNHFPNWVVFLLGLGIILLSFHLFDKCLPQMTLKESQVGWMSRLVYRPWVMFFLGALVTTLSMSVSLSLSILVPLSARGFIRRENVIPYILGANITTFIDTLLAAVLLNNPAAFTIVFVEMFSISVLSLLILTIFYRNYQRMMLQFVGQLTENTRNLVIFMIVIIIVPIILLWM
jgi:sodium-dependent phosphate cotransporter